MARAVSSNRECATAVCRRVRPVCAVMMAVCMAGRSADREALREASIPNSMGVTSRPVRAIHSKTKGWLT